MAKSSDNRVRVVEWRRIAASGAAWARRSCAAAPILALSLAAGCVTVEGAGSGRMKKQLTQSFLYKSARMFYPQGVSGSPEDLPPLDRKAVASAEQSYQAILRAIGLRHARQHEHMSALFGRPLVARIDARVMVDDQLYSRGLPLARMEADGTLLLSTKVAQSMYRTAILYGMSSSEPGGVRFMSGDIEMFGKRAESEREMIGQFNQMMDKAQGLKGRTLVGDLVSGFGDDDLDGPWFQMAELVQMSTEVENAYYAPISFMIAHELGHLALGHFATHPAALGGVDQDACRRQETEADIYAFALTSTAPEYRHLLSNGVAEMGDSIFRFGYEEFFRSAYDLARFAPPSGVQAAGQCSYDTAQQRYEFLDRIKRATVERSENLTLAEMLALKAQPAAADTGGAR